MFPDWLWFLFALSATTSVAVIISIIQDYKKQKAKDSSDKGQSKKFKVIEFKQKQK